MKKLCALLSMLMVVGMFNVVASAAGTTDATLTLTADKTTVAKGDTVTITVAMTADTSGTMGLHTTTHRVAPAFNLADFEFVSYEVASSSASNYGLSNDPGFSQDTLSQGFIVFSQKVAASEDKPDGDFQFGTFTLRAISETAKTSQISFNASATTVSVNLLEGATSGTKATVAENATLDIAITAGSQGGSVNATQSGSTFTDAADAKAVAYYVELDSKASEKTGRWYATIGTTPMKTVATFTLPNISAENVKLGLVYKGAETVSDVAFKWE